MAIRDQELFKLIEKIQDHYHNNINNRFVRKALLYLMIPRETRTALENLTQKTDEYKIRGYQYDELYQQILAAATFIYHVKREIQPKLKGMLAGGGETVFSRSAGASPQEQILREMAISNFPANLGVLADLINELYLKTVALDKEEHAGRHPAYEKIPELKELGRLLV